MFKNPFDIRKQNHKAHHDHMKERWLDTRKSLQEIWNLINPTIKLQLESTADNQKVVEAVKKLINDGQK